MKPKIYIFFVLISLHLHGVSILSGNDGRENYTAVPPFGHVDAVVIYSCDASSDKMQLPDWYDDICDPENLNSIPNYFKDISFGHHTLTMTPYGQDDKNCIVSHVKLNANPSFIPLVNYFEDIMYKADMVINFADFDKDNDGYVDYLFFVVANRGGTVGQASGYNYTTMDRNDNGEAIKIHSDQCSLNRIRNHVGAKMLLTHEYGHALGLEDLDHSMTKEYSHISVGGFGLMVNGNGFENTQGCIVPPLRAAGTFYTNLGWIDPISVSYTKNQKIRDFQTSGELYLLNSEDPAQYFYVSNHQKLSVWEYYWPGKGLLIWHINEKGSQPDRLRKQIDLEAAHGLYEWDLPNPEKMQNTLIPDPKDGLDSMDVRGVYENWRMKGSASCFFREGYNESFDDASNPNSNLHIEGTPYSQRIKSHILVRNIKDDPDEDHVILADMCNNAWQGHIKNSKVWETARSPYFLHGDLIIEEGASLIIEEGVEIISTGDYSLTIGQESTLLANGTAENPILFTSLDSSWQGLHFYNVHTKTKLKHCIIENAEYGAYCDGCLPIFSNCTFQFNTTDTYYVNRPLKQEPATILPDNYYLASSYPNPFNPKTTIPFGMPENSHVKIILFDTQGREVYILTNREYAAGHHEITFNGSSYANGIYYMILKMEPSDLSQQSRIHTQKIILLK